MLFENEEAVKTMQKKALFKNWIEPHILLPKIKYIDQDKWINISFYSLLVTLKGTGELTFEQFMYLYSWTLYQHCFTFMHTIALLDVVIIEAHRGYIAWRSVVKVGVGLISLM